MKCISEADFGEKDGKSTSYLNIYSGLAAYEILRENGFDEAQELKYMTSMCSHEKIAGLSYKLIDTLPHGFEEL